MLYGCPAVLQLRSHVLLTSGLLLVTEERIKTALKPDWKLAVISILEHVSYIIPANQWLSEHPPLSPTDWREDKSTGGEDGGGMEGTVT